MTVSHYRTNLRDIEFNLFEVLGADDYLGTGPFSSVDGEQARMILTEMERFCRESIWAESFKGSYQAYLDAEWWRMDVPAELGGTVVPPALRWAVAELVLGSNPAVHMYSSGF